MLLRIKREVFRVGEFEEHFEEGALTRDEICAKYRLDKELTSFIDSATGHVIEGDIISGNQVMVAVMPAGGVSAGVLFLLLATAIVGVVATIGIVNSMKMSSPKTVFSNSLRGSMNPIRKDGGIGVLLGKYRIPGDVAGLVYSSYEAPAGTAPDKVDEENDQYIHQLFCNGYSDVVYETDPKFVKEGVNPNGYVVHMGESPIDVYKDLQLERPDGNGTLYTKRCVEEGLSLKLMGPDEPVIRTTPTNTVRIGVGICAPYGYYNVNDNGEEEELSMKWAVAYREAGTDGVWIQFDYADKAINCYRYRHMAEVTLPKGQYEVKVTRLDADSDDSKHNDTLMVEFMQFDTVSAADDSPLPVRNADKYALLGIKVRATDQLNGYLDQIYVDGFLKCRTLTNPMAVPGPQEWNVPSDVTHVGTMNNPASIFLYLLTNKNVNPRAIDIEKEPEKIDWVSLKEWWNFCNDRGWSVNAWVTERITVGELIKNVCMAGRAHFRMNDGKYGVLIEKATPNVSQMFTPRNAWSMSETKSFEEQPNLLKIQFLNESTGNEETRYVSLVDGKFSYDEPWSEDQYVSESLDIWGVTNPKQIAEIATYRLAGLHTLNRSYAWSCGIENILCSVGDVVYLANDLFMYSLGYGRIVSLERDASNAVTGVFVDESMGLDTSKNYGITVRQNDGTFKTYPVNQVTSKTNLLRFVTPVTGNIMEGNLFFYGDANEVGKKVVIQEIKPGSDFTATITAVDYVPEIYDVDKNQVIPEYKSNINEYGSGATIGKGGSGRPDFDPPSLNTAPRTLGLSLSSNVFHYDTNGALAPSVQTVVATANATGFTPSRYFWKVNGVTRPETGNTIEITPDALGAADNINVTVTADNFIATRYIFRLADGKRGPEGIQGPQGWSTATVALYKKMTSEPGPYKGSQLTYTFSTSTLEGANFDGWSRTIPSGDGKLWVIYASAFSQAKTDTIEPSDWTSPEILSQDGTQGLAGLNVASLQLYARMEGTPSPVSSRISYNFINHTMSNISAPWQTEIPKLTNNKEKIWITIATASSRTNGDTVEASEWTAPVVFATNGDKGETGGQGQPGVTPVVAVSDFDSYSFPSDQFGNIPSEELEKMVCNVRAVQGNKNLTYSANLASNGTFKVTVVDHVGLSEATNNGASIVLPSSTVFLGNSAIITYEVTSKDFGGLQHVHTLKINLVKSRQGVTGPQGPEGQAGSSGKDGLPGKDGVSVTAIKTQYQVVASGGSPNPSKWEDSVPTRGDNQVLWVRDVITYSDKTNEATTGRPVTGDKGSKGDTGARGEAGAKGETGAVGPQGPAGGTGPAGPQGAKGDKGETGATGGQGPKGTDGVSITGVYAQFQIGSSATTAPTGTWLDTVPTRANNQYLWTRDKITYSKGDPTYTKPRNITGDKGNTGDKGETGGRGPQGLTGQYTAYQYYASTSDTSQVGGSWSSTMPSIAGGKFLWMRTQTVPAGGSIDGSKWGTPVLAGTDISKVMASIDAVDGKVDGVSQKVTQNTASITANSKGLETQVKELAKTNGIVSDHTSKISQNTQGISAQVQSLKETDEAVSNNTTAINQTSESLKTIVTSYDDKFDAMSSSITQTADGIYLKVEGDSVTRGGTSVGKKEDGVIKLDAGEIMLAGSVTATQINVVGDAEHEGLVPALMAQSMSLNSAKGYISSQEFSTTEITSPDGSSIKVPTEGFRIYGDGSSFFKGMAANDGNFNNVSIFGNSDFEGTLNIKNESGNTIFETVRSESYSKYPVEAKGTNAATIGWKGCDFYDTFGGLEKGIYKANEGDTFNGNRVIAITNYGSNSLSQVQTLSTLSTGDTWSPTITGKYWITFPTETYKDTRTEGSWESRKVGSGSSKHVPADDFEPFNPSPGDTYWTYSYTGTTPQGMKNYDIYENTWVEETVTTTETADVRLTIDGKRYSYSSSHADVSFTLGMGKIIKFEYVPSRPSKASIYFVPNENGIGAGVTVVEGNAKRVFGPRDFHIYDVDWKIRGFSRRSIGKYKRFAGVTQNGQQVNSKYYSGFSSSSFRYVEADQTQINDKLERSFGFSKLMVNGNVATMDNYSTSGRWYVSYTLSGVPLDKDPGVYTDTIKPINETSSSLGTKTRRFPLVYADKINTNKISGVVTPVDGHEFYASTVPIYVYTDNIINELWEGVKDGLRVLGRMQREQYGNTPLFYKGAIGMRGYDSIMMSILIRSADLAGPENLPEWIEGFLFGWGHTFYIQTKHGVLTMKMLESIPG